MCPYCLSDTFSLLTDDIAKCLLCGSIFDLNEDAVDERHTTFLKLKAKKHREDDEEDDLQQRRK
jgi:hypothetical protein